MKSIRKSMKSRSGSRDKVTTSPLLPADNGDSSLVDDATSRDSQGGRYRSTSSSTPATSPAPEDTPMVTFDNDGENDVFAESNPLYQAKQSAVQKWAKVVNAKRKDAKKQQIHFAEMPFQTYEVSKGKAVCLKSHAVAILAVLLFVVLPSPVISIVTIVYAVRMHKKIVDTVERKPLKDIIIPCVILIVFAVTKDGAIVAMVLYQLFQPQLDSYLAIYSIVALATSLICFLEPLIANHVAKARYEYSSTEGVKGKAVLNKYTDASEVYLQSRFPFLNSISDWTDELSFTAKANRAWLSCLMVVIAVLVVMIHSISPWIFTASTASNRTDASPNVSSGLLLGASSNATNATRDGIETAIIAICSVTNAGLGIVLAAVFSWVILWQVALAGSWDGFNQLERSDATTCLDDKWDSVVHWWRAFQMLHFFTTTRAVLSNAIRDALCCVSIVLMLLLLAEAAGHLLSGVGLSPEGSFLLMLDAASLCLGLLVVMRMGHVVNCNRLYCLRLIQSKMMNINHEVSRLSSDDGSEAKGGELSQQVSRLKQKRLRATASLFQGMLPLVSASCEQPVLSVPSGPIAAIVIVLVTATTVALGASRFYFKLLTDDGIE